VRYVRRSDVIKTLHKLSERVPDQCAEDAVLIAGVEVTPERVERMKAELQLALAQAARMLEPV